MTSPTRGGPGLTGLPAPIADPGAHSSEATQAGAVQVIQFFQPGPESAGTPKKGPRDAKPLTPRTTSNGQAQRSHGGCHWERRVRKLSHHEPSAASV